MPEACAVASAGERGPAARMVLLKHVDERGFVFASNYRSRKGRDFDANPRAAILFYWQPPGRQVRVEGTVERVSDAESDAIWFDRPRASRLSALASRQSEPEPREELEARVRDVEAAHEGSEVERPEWWGGYRVVPERIEFWEHRDDRLHVRVLYRRDAARWTAEELDP
jgi:pyridoxamine 5'-phosphate oxidase